MTSGRKTSDAEGEGLVRKRTKILTKSDEVAKRVARKCTKDHRHVNLIGSRAKRAHRYPHVLSWAFCEGAVPQQRQHALGMMPKPS